MNYIKIHLTDFDQIFTMW